jgi:hypothetical protein
MTSSPSVARLKITLDDVEPAVVRRLEVPLDLCIPDAEWGRGSGPLDARKATLQKVIEDTGAKTLTYLYDFGDGWEHTIRSSASDPAIRP